MGRVIPASRLPALLLLSLLNACATVQVTGPDKQDAGLSGPCATQPEVLCEAGAPPGGPTCSPDPDAGYYQGLVPPGVTYAQGCVVNFPDPRPLKDTGECILTAQCTCSDPTRARGPQWTCVR